MAEERNDGDMKLLHFYIQYLCILLLLSIHVVNEKDDGNDNKVFAFENLTF